MRAIERQISEAWLNHRSRRIDNTEVRVRHDGLVSLSLFGNVIAMHSPISRRTVWTCAGWKSPTTRSRLNNVVFTSHTGRIYQHKHELLIAHTWIDNEWKINTPIQASIWYEMKRFGDTANHVPFDSHTDSVDSLRCF